LNYLLRHKTVHSSKSEYATL